MSVVVSDERLCTSHTWCVQKTGTTGALRGSQLTTAFRMREASHREQSVLRDAVDGTIHSQDSDVLGNDT